MLLLAAQIHPNALIGLCIAIGAGAAFNNRVFAIGQCASQFFVLSLLGAELFAHRGEFLLFGADGDLALDQSKNKEQNSAATAKGSKRRAMLLCWFMRQRLLPGRYQNAVVCKPLYRLPAQEGLMQAYLNTV